MLPAAPNLGKLKSTLVKSQPRPDKAQSLADFLWAPQRRTACMSYFGSMIWVVLGCRVNYLPLL